MIKTTAQLLRWFSENDIPTDGFTLILNFQDAKAGSRFDAAIRRETDPLCGPSSNPLDLRRQFKMNGLSVKIESPIHDEDDVIRRIYDPTIPVIDRMRRA
jgi:hypothetical protein